MPLKTAFLTAMFVTVSILGFMALVYDEAVMPGPYSKTLGTHTPLGIIGLLFFMGGIILMLVGFTKMPSPHHHRRNERKIG